MSVIKVDTLVNSNNDGAVIFEKGAIIPSGQQLTVNGNINVSGIITATQFSGDGSNLTGIGGSATSISANIAWGMLFGNYYRA
jgi:hypothetical protein